MDRVVYYHHPSAENFSLAQSSESPQELRQRSQNGDESTKLLGYPFDTPVYVRYVGDSRVRTAAEATFDQDRLAAEITALPEYELDITPSTAQQKYAQEHERLCREFVRRVLGRACRTDLCETSGLSLEQFVAYLDDSEPRNGDTGLF